ncbi:MAG: polysaccharide biosynthesis/export family protein [Bryobacteraceae bacterium]
MRTVLIATLLAGWSAYFLAAQAPDAGAQTAQQPAASPVAQIPQAAGPAVDPAKMAAPAAATKATPPSTKVYIIGAEDVLRIVIWNNAPMSGEFPVRPDGAISIPLLGDVMVAQKTPQEVEQDIAKRLIDGQLIRDPHVSVGLTAVHSKKYYIQGEVNKPGSYDLVVPTTVMEGLVNAGGFRDFANTRKIRILRGSQELKFNYNQVSHGKGREQNIYLEPGDQIIVP